MTRPPRAPGVRPRQGAAAVEFALIAVVFFMLFIGAAEVGRILWIWNAASEATRLGARLAVVCDMNDADIKARMRNILGDLDNIDITLTYDPPACDATDCQTVTVTLSGYTAQSFIPFTTFQPRLPPFRTALSRESMSSANNPVCG